MKTITDFQTFTDTQSEHYLADHWPTGKLTGKRHFSNSVIYKFILSLSTFVKITIGDIFILAKNRDISQADELLIEWEKSVKIPEVIPRRSTLAGRREAVECLVRKIPVYNIDDGIVNIKTTFSEYVRCLTGIDVEVRTAQVEGSGASFSLEFPVFFGLGGGVGSFLFIVGVPVVGAPANNVFPLEFAVSFFNPTIPDATIELLDLVLDRVIPSFCRWEYEVIAI
jgi:hypothetical protein